MATEATSASAHLDLQVNTVIIVVFNVVFMLSLNLIHRYMIETANKYRVVQKSDTPVLILR